MNQTQLQPVIHARKRAKKPRARTGCMICKTRRIKCDETRPNCNNCLSYLGKCAGYAKEAPYGPVEPRALLPKDNVQTLYRTPASGHFKNDVEYGYYQRFCILLTDERSGMTRHKLLWKVALQAGDKEACVLQAIIAVGALDLSNLECRKEGSDSYGLDISRREFAYSAYHKAITTLRYSLENGNCSIMTKLISCILFACFEAFHGNNDTASKQVFAGIKMLVEYVTLRKQSRRVQLPEIDSDLLKEYTILEVQAAAFGDERSPEDHLNALAACTDQLGSIPTEFSTIQDATYALYNIILQAIHLRASQMHGPEERSIDAVFPLIGLMVGPMLSEQAALMMKFSTWNMAFRSLWWKSQGPLSREFSKEGRLLRMHYLGGICWAAIGIPGSHTKYTKVLKEIVRLTKRLVEEGVADAQFSMDMVFVLPLAIVGWGYKHRASRREIIKLFRNFKRQESVWNARMMAKIMEWLVEIEEEGLENEEYVPEDVAAAITSLKIDGIKETVLVTAIQGVKGHAEEKVFIKRLIYWGVESNSSSTCSCVSIDKPSNYCGSTEASLLPGQARGIFDVMTHAGIQDIGVSYYTYEAFPPKYRAEICSVEYLLA